MSTTRNTAYKIKADIVDSENGLNVEEGALHVYNNELKVHLNGSIETVSTGSGGGTNPTSGVMPYNNGGVFADTPFSYYALPTKNIYTSMEGPYSFNPTWGDYGLNITNNAFKLGVFSNLVSITPNNHLGLQMEYTGYTGNFSFGRSYDFLGGVNYGDNLNGFAFGYEGYAAMGASDSSLAINSSGEMVLNGSLGAYNDPNGYSTSLFYYNYISVRIGMSTYRIPLYS